MLQFEFPWALALLPLPLLVYWLAPEFRDHGEAVRVPFFGRLVKLTGKDPQSGAVVQLAAGHRRTCKTSLGWGADRAGKIGA